MRVLRSILLMCFLGNNLILAQWDKYPSYDEYLNIMNKFQEDYPKLCTLVKFGTSVQDRELLAVKISDNVTEDEAEPEIFYLSTIHGDEVGGYILMLHLIDYLLSKYGEDSVVTRLVDSVEIWINPLANPDGTYLGGNNSVLYARRRNANNVDLCRSFPCPFGDLLYAPEKETEAIIDFCEEHHFNLAAEFHAGAEGIYYPWASVSSAHPDKYWFRYVGVEWAEEAWSDGPIPPVEQYCSGIVPIPIIGDRMDHVLYYQQCRMIRVELSNQKLLQESQLIDLWNRHKQSMLNYIMESFNGIKGTVTNSFTGEPLRAKVFVENHDKDSSRVFSHLPNGDYYRPINAGTYDVTFSADGYEPKTFKDVKAENGKATVLDVQLSDFTGNNSSKEHSISGISVYKLNGMIKIVCDVKSNSDIKATIFDISGKIVKNLNTIIEKGRYNIIWNRLDNNGNAVSEGCYIVCVECAGKTRAKRFIFSR